MHIARLHRLASELGCALVKIEDSAKDFGQVMYFIEWTDGRTLYTHSALSRDGVEAVLKELPVNQPEERRAMIEADIKAHRGHAFKNWSREIIPSKKPEADSVAPTQEAVDAFEAARFVDTKEAAIRRKDLSNANKRARRALEDTYTGTNAVSMRSRLSPSRPPLGVFMYRQWTSAKADTMRAMYLCQLAPTHCYTAREYPSATRRTIEAARAYRLSHAASFRLPA